MQTLGQTEEAASPLSYFFDQSAWGMYLVTCLLYILILLVQESFILTDAVYFNSLGEQLTTERIAQWLETQHRWAWISYAMIPVSVALQVLLITICLNIGSVLLDYPVSFRTLFGTVVKAVSVFAVGKGVYVSILLTMEVHTLDDLFKADMFSLLGWIGKENVPFWLTYPLSVLNVFELAFFLLLAGGLALLIKRPFREMLNFVAGTYGIGLIIWILFIVFLQLNLM